MQPQLFVPPLTTEHRQALRAGLRSAEAFTARRCQILLASADGKAPSAIARDLRCSAPTVRNAIHAFAREGLDCLREKSSRPHSARPLLGASHADPLKEILHQRPRAFGKPTGVWTLDLVAEVCHAKGWMAHVVAGETVRQASSGWASPGGGPSGGSPARIRLTRGKKARDRLIRLAAAHPGWVLGFQDETWWNRLALPAMHAWAGESTPLRLVERAMPKGDPDPKALSCDGLLRADTGRMMVRFVSGWPVSQVTEDYLGWVCERLAAEGKKALLLV